MNVILMDSDAAEEHSCDSLFLIKTTERQSDKKEKLPTDDCVESLSFLSVNSQPTNSSPFSEMVNSR